jgi:adenylosuccinate synthase
MQKSRFNVVTDGQWGSCGKGAITTALAYKFRPAVLSTTNMANAGHTAVFFDGQSFIAKVLPSATALAKWTGANLSPPADLSYSPQVVIGPSAAFDIEQLQKEIEHCGLEPGKLMIHPRAGVISKDHKEKENDDKNGTKHIASTMQGCGAFLADKVMRRPDLKLARDYEELKQYVPQTPLWSLPMWVNQCLKSGATILHEGSQGFSLDINHGSHYPQCTSRSTTALQNMVDMGVNAAELGDIYLVIRPYPIRVGNVVENGEIKGYSGDCYDDHQEISWEQVASQAGAPAHVMQGELTTVTKRLRRVFTFSKRQLVEAVVTNGATKIALNFANYIDWSCFGVNEYDRLPQKVKEFISKIEDLVQIPVSIVGTGPAINHCVFMGQ